jgi:hypothetical protein
MAITTTRATCGEHAAPLFYAAGDVFCEKGCDLSWSDLRPEVGERISTREGDEIFASEVVIIREDGVYGDLVFDVEGTGGMARALVREMDDSSVVAITDGMAGLDFESTGEIVVTIYSHADDWDDSGAEPVYTITTPDLPSALAAIARLYREV